MSGGAPIGNGSQRATAPLLAPGATVAVLAPAGPAEPSRVARVEALYAVHGLKARLYPSCHARLDDRPYLAGDDALRLADLHAALADPDVATIHALRGGYGAMRLLDGIDATLVRRARKLLVGYSDITALHALWLREGAPSLHAPMAASDLLLDAPGHAADREALFAFLRGGAPAGHVLCAEPATATAPLRWPGVAEGPLVGGNLSLVAALLGTPWAFHCTGAILFLEDVSEEPYRVDRLLTQLRLAGVLDAVCGIVLGSFTDAASPLALLHDLLLPLAQRRGVPLLGGWPAGHGTPNRPLPLGVRMRLVVSEDAAEAGTLELLQPFAPQG